MTKKNLISLIENDKWMMDILHTVRRVALPDWWIGAGFVRSKVWDTLHGYKTRTPLPDIDVVYLDRSEYGSGEEQGLMTQKTFYYLNKLKKLRPDVNWSVTNETNANVQYGVKPYKTTEDALEQWTETATCIGVKLDSKNNVLLAAPRGIEDLVNLVLRPSSGIYKDLKIFNERIKEKEWLKKWPKLKIIID